MSGEIRAPVGFSKVGPADDDRRAQALIANQIQEVRIND
jgi:hypothetical protein